MSIKLLARDLYRLQKKVERLQTMLVDAPMEKQPVIENALRKARAEKESLRRALDSQINR